MESIDCLNCCRFIRVLRQEAKDPDKLRQVLPHEIAERVAQLEAAFPNAAFAQLVLIVIANAIVPAQLGLSTVLLEFAG
jgi:hypothetical protein